MKLDFKNYTIVITGGSKGIGLYSAIAYASLGANVFIVSRSKLSASNKKLLKNFSKIKFYTGNASNEKFISQLFKKIYLLTRRFDILINNAGVPGLEKIEKIKLENWNYVISNNLTSVFVCSKEAVKYMKKNKQGSIINISSVAARNRSIVAGVHYTASKAAIIGFSRQLAYELSKENIRVNSIAPGQTRTDMLKKAIKNNAINIRNLNKHIPLGRIAETSDVVNAILFISSNKSSYITGSVIDINGGVI